VHAGERRLLFGFACALAFFGAIESGATTLFPLDLAGLVAQADRVVLARVERVSSRWTADRGAILTEATLRIEQALKGRASDELVVAAEAEQRRPHRPAHPSVMLVSATSRGRQ
jgi:hypothetical protein